MKADAHEDYAAPCGYTECEREAVDLVSIPHVGFKMMCRWHKDLWCCGGDDDCTSNTHVHGCYADSGSCDAPQEHI